MPDFGMSQELIDYMVEDGVQEECRPVDVLNLYDEDENLLMLMTMIEAAYWTGKISLRRRTSRRLLEKTMQGAFSPSWRWWSCYSRDQCGVDAL
jgi:hypothetical protein